MAGTYLTHTTSTPTNSDKATLSFWLKRSKLSSGQGVFAQDTDGNDKFAFILGSNDTISIFQETAGTVDINLVTNRVFRDTSAWYNFVLHFDSTQGAGSNRVQLFVNGVQETSFSTATYPSSDVDFRFNKSGIVQEIGRYEGGNYFDGLLSHINFIDGTIYSASTFGSTDSTTGEWKINTSPSVTYGNNGFFIFKNNGSKTDQSGKGNNFSEEGSPGIVSNTEDCPSDVFATLNSLDSDLTSNPFSNGNTKVTGQNPESVKYYCGLTLGMMGDGKYYFEAQLNVNNQGILGVCNLDASDNPTYLRQQNTFPGRYSSSWGYDLTDGYKFNNNNKTSYGSGTSWAANDFISFALDNTNGKMYIAKNGSWVSGGDPTNGTGGIDYSAIGDNNMFIVADNNSAGYNRFSFNFGNGAFDSTALGTTYSPTVGNTGAKFKYNIIPTGYTALSTKGLNL